jgi:hypothetical protein
MSWPYAGSLLLSSGRALSLCFVQVLLPISTKQQAVDATDPHSNSIEQQQCGEVTEAAADAAPAA